ncbi:PLP-dependent aminotransferase family protein [Parashewanella spongiae]|uniref:PLP-dependent aminotransferase family protein n=1 Tax=Parashewanella spongiae TaxID=342950 RepID=A0A3A6TMX4_9GAMM|nr:PLP-dependent aminotransferase family protein [Parashewanella spongiae]MCL1079978.1 PLP-dependent aminotransferase family protein [Parashewanella spongiae]RJY05990.1 PLP-dependent aminotransferase family protein [Parashewanella spongiae]
MTNKPVQINAKFKYQKLVDEIVVAIESGLLTGKLPSVRKASKDRSVSISTISQAYAELERLGWIFSESKRGYFIHQTRNENSKPQYGHDITSISNGRSLAESVQYSLNDPNVFPLSSTAPSSVLDNEKVLNRLSKKTSNNRVFQKNLEEPIAGLPEYRQALSRYWLSQSLLLTQDQIIATHGRNEGLLTALLAMNKSGKAVAVESPTSFYFQAVISQLNFDVIEIPQQHNYQDELMLLELAYSTHKFDCLVVNPSFNDPTGRLLSKGDKLDLLHWASRNQVTIIEYDRSELYFSCDKPSSLVNLAINHSIDNLRLISIGDFFDTLSPTLKLGYMVCLNCFQECLLTRQTTLEPVNLHMQHIITECLESGQYSKLLRNLRHQLRINYIKANTIFSELLELGTYISQPNGGPCLWFQLPKGVSSHGLWEMAINAQLSIAPGTVFSFSNNFEDFFRVTFALPWDDSMESALIKLTKLTKDFVK